jgi:Mn2+/Fe2+ NRAMP family transporter
MATSAIGPGFLTQTAVFTERLGASFGFAIVASIVIDLVAQVTIWRTVVAHGARAQVLANGAVPGAGTALAGLVVVGGLAFNIGNVAGAGLGLQALAGLDVRVGAALSAALAIGLFLVRDAGRAMDRLAIALGFVMISLTAIVALSSSPPLGDAVRETFLPSRVEPLAIVTIVGGTVGGYITFAGAHRLLDDGIAGADAVPLATRAAATAIGAASLMRLLLFLAALGVVARHGTLDAANPPASVFRLALGSGGERLFALIMWSAALTSVVGAAYTSVSFLRGLVPALERRWAAGVAGFIGISALVFVTVGRPVTVLVLVGALNALVLPLGLGTMLVAGRRADAPARLPTVLAAAAALVVVAMTALGGWTLVTEVRRLPGGG